MAINWSHLPPEVIAKICMCSRGGKDSGWHLNEATGYWTHPKCEKPSPIPAIRECELCGKAFVPDKYIPKEEAMWGVACSDCL